MATGSIRRSSRLVLAGLLAAGCAAPAPPRQEAPRISVVLVPDAGGFAVEGSDLRIDWGRAEPGAVAALSKGFGPVLATEPCGALRAYGFARVTAYFRERALRGWRSDAGQAGEVC